MESQNGLILTLLYGVIPNRLRFCGPGETAEQNLLYSFLRHKRGDKKEIRRLIIKFKAAYAYYELIARANDIGDPLDKKVVRAYWLGNELLDKVRISDLRKMVANKFSQAEKAEAVPGKSKPHHSFHVLILGPVNKELVFDDRLLDLCRVSWGRVKKILKGGKIIVSYKPLLRRDRRLSLAIERDKEINWDEKITPRLKEGDWVSFHWNQVAEVLTEEDIKNLEKYTRLTLNLQ